MKAQCVREDIPKHGERAKGTGHRLPSPNLAKGNALFDFPHKESTKKGGEP